MKWKSSGTSFSERKGWLSKLISLALFFLGGVLVGQVLSDRIPPAVGDELERYLQDYFRLTHGESRNSAVFFSTLLVYFRYPLLSFLLGFASLGIFLLPCVTAAYGFFLSYSVCCFTASFGTDGVILALSVFGLRCLATLPCYFLLAVPAWEMSAQLAALSLGKGRRAAVGLYRKQDWIRCGICLVVLLAGACLEWILSPSLLHTALERILT